jgi:arsenite transporter
MTDPIKKVVLPDEPKKTIGLFEKYLTIWVALGILAGIGIGHFAGDSIQIISSLEIARVNIPVAILIWLMIYPMMLQIDFSSIRQIRKRPRGLYGQYYKLADQALYHGILCMDFFEKFILHGLTLPWQVSI